jgi:hypothetical protein
VFDTVNLPMILLAALMATGSRAFEAVFAIAFGAADIKILTARLT